MSWSSAHDLKQKENAFRLLLDVSHGQFTRSLEWYPKSKSNIHLAVWSQLYEDGLIDWYTPGGDSFCLTLHGWIEACSILRNEISLDQRFAVLSAHLKELGGRTGTSTTTNTIAEKTRLSPDWVFDTIDGQMAEKIYNRHGAKVASRMGDVDIAPHIGKSLT
jgi:hypothetical protein